MPARRVAVALSTFAAALAVAGCGSASSGDTTSTSDVPAAQRPIVKAVDDLSDAGRDRDYDRICRDLITTQLADRLTAAQSTDACPDQLKKPLGEVGQTDLDVVASSIRVSGQTASVQVRSDLGDREATDTIQLARQGGRWKVSGL